MQRAAGAGGTVDDLAFEPEAARLKAVVVVRQVDVFAFGRDRAVEQHAADRLHVGRQHRSAFDGQWRVAHAHFDRAELGLRPDIPVKILHALDHAERL